MFQSKADRALAATVGGGLFLQGTAELIARLAEPMPLFFWLPTLWGWRCTRACGFLPGKPQQATLQSIGDPRRMPWIPT